MPIDPYAFQNAFAQSVQMGRQRRADQNALAQQQVDNERNRLRDMYMGEQQQWALEDRKAQQDAVKRQTLYRVAQSVVSSQDPIGQSRAVAPELQKLGLPTDLASLDGADPETVRAQAKQLADSLAPFMEQQESTGVHSAYQAEDGSLLYLDRNGRVVNTGQQINKFAPQLAEVGGGLEVYDPNRPRQPRAVVSTPGAQVSAAATQAGAVRGAQENAANAADAAKAQALNKKAFDSYNVAMQGLGKALGNTATGPVAGRLPSVTAKQQIAEGAVAAMAPLLKQLFRSAGEGTFTDKDQELLLAMVPTRKDHPEAAAAKIEMIDQIVAAKLGVPYASRFGGEGRQTGGEEITATGPNGQKLALRNGQWVPL